jgi:dimeric dUTPase (all-alpha-NTP-PPase superfamily)
MSQENGPDRLEEIFRLQKQLNAGIIEQHGLFHITDGEWIQKHALALFVEMGEVLNELPYKWWKADQRLDETRLKEELIDVLHFFVSMCLAAGLDAQELYEIYAFKNQKNEDRQKGLTGEPGYHS